MKKYGVRIYMVSVLVRLVLFAMLVLPKLSVWEQRFVGDGVPGGYYDDVSYRNMSQILVHDHVFGGFGDEKASIYRTPAYTVFLAALGLLTGFTPVLMTVLQIFVMSLTPVLFLKIMNKLKLPEWTAWLLVFDPLTILMSISLMTEALLTLLLVGAFYFWLDSEKPRSRYMCMLMLALGALTKPTVFYLIPIAAAAMIWQYRKRAHTVLAVLLAAALLCGWMARNYRVAGLFVLSTQSDNSILVVETIKAIQSGVPESQVLLHIINKWQAEKGVHPYDPITDNKIDFAGEAMSFVRQNPLTVVQFEVRGAVRLLLGSGRSLMRNVFFPGMDVAALRYYDLFMAGFYGLLYFLIAISIRPWKTFRVPWLLAAWGVLAYNIALMALFSWTTGGALKRSPVVPFFYLVLVGQYFLFYRDLLASWWKKAGLPSNLIGGNHGKA